MQVSRFWHFESQKRIYRQHKSNTCGSWWYIKVLWSKTIGLCKKLNIIYNIVTCSSEPQVNIPEWRPVNKWIFFMNRFFLWTGWTSWPNQTEPSETAHGSSSTDLQVTQSKLPFGRLTVTLTQNEPSGVYVPVMLVLSGELMKTSLFTLYALTCKTSKFHIIMGALKV